MNLRETEKTLHVAVVLDESGSMTSVKKETLSGLNEYIQELKKKEDGINTTFSLITFSGTVNCRIIAKPIEEINELTNKDYIPSGTTAMYDGVGIAIGTLKSETVADEYTDYLLLVISDGEENASKEFTSEKIAYMIKECQDTKRWTITYMGANQDLSIVKETLNLHDNNITLYNSSNTGTSDVVRRMSDNTIRYRSALTNSVDMVYFLS